MNKNKKLRSRVHPQSSWAKPPRSRRIPMPNRGKTRLQPHWSEIDLIPEGQEQRGSGHFRTVEFEAGHWAGMADDPTRALLYAFQ